MEKCRSAFSNLFQNHLRRRVIGRVRHRKMNFIRAGFFQNRFGFARNRQTRNALRVVQNFDVAPRYFSAPAGFQSFQKSFFRRKTRRETLRRSRAFRFAVGAFLVGKNALDESRRSFQSFADAVDFDNVDAD